MNVVDDFNRTLLSIAVDSGNLDLVELLVANGADVNQEVPRFGRGTVLHEACSV